MVQQSNDKKKVTMPEDPAALREAVARPLTRPFDMVILTVDRIQAVLDEAVAQGRMTRDDAQEVAQELVLLGRSQTERVVTEIESLISEGRDRIDSAKRTARDAAKRVIGKGGANGEPIKGYGDMTANEAIAALDELDSESLRGLHDYEKRNANRKTVLRAVDQKLNAGK